MMYRILDFPASDSAVENVAGNIRNSEEKEEDENSPNSKQKKFRKLIHFDARLEWTSSETRFSALNKRLNRKECEEASPEFSGDVFQ